ncbi:MAG: 3-deoxy-7-phosphoheptulonate synthase [Odoribacter sp.]|nr:3-deoxy-7-phosphoheptulonate synthase [Odoribacter sp.]
MKMEITPLHTWFEGFDNYPFIIAGPCSAESEHQVLETAGFLKATGRVNLFRAGIWKPRTRPGTFSGAGTKALKWLERVRSEFNLRVTVEVASPKHIEACLKHGIDVLWIGARSVSNPFSVEELSQALRGVDIPVLIKNPLSPDIDLWTGAVERIYSAGVKRIAAIHRGFSPFERTLYRNMPKWELPIELRQRFNNLPVLCDPSHIAGRADLVGEIAQKAMDLNMSGLMIEVHPKPSEALSDSAQQLGFEAFSRLINGLIIRKPTTDNKRFLNRLEELRHQIDSIDHQIVELIASRMNISSKMGDYKCRNNVTILQMERWLEVLRTRTEQGMALGLEKSFMERVMKLFHQESIRIQTEIMNNLRTNGECGSEDKRKEGDNNINRNYPWDTSDTED